MEKEKNDLPIQWTFGEGKDITSRSKEHQEFLIEQYNRNRPVDQQVRDMGELNRALLNTEIKYIGKSMFLKITFIYSNSKIVKFNNKIYFTGYIDIILSFLLKYETM